MKLIPIDPNNLCKDYVLAYSVSEKKLIGKLANMNGDVVCVSHETSLSNISHYLPLTDIKPESEKERRYLVSSTYMAKKDGGAGYYNSNNEITQAAGKSLIETLSSYFDYIQNEACTKLEVSIDSIIQLSFNCIEI